VGRDLLDDWTVEIRYGRCGQGKKFASSKADEMKALIYDRLRRRLSAPKRIGCPYRLAAFNATPGFDASSWLFRPARTSRTTWVLNVSPGSCDVMLSPWAPMSPPEFANSFQNLVWRDGLAA
jgi:hypothetical protein